MEPPRGIDTGYKLDGQPSPSTYYVKNEEKRKEFQTPENIMPSDQPRNI